MTSNKPYLIRAFYEWISDNDMTPFILVDAESVGVIVPRKYVVDGRIILNISLSASHDLRIGNDAVECKTCFKGISSYIYIPIEAVNAIYAQENNQGLIFSGNLISRGQFDEDDIISGDLSSDEFEDDNLEGTNEHTRKNKKGTAKIIPFPRGKN